MVVHLCLIRTQGRIFAEEKGILAWGGEGGEKKKVGFFNVSSFLIGVKI